MLGGDRTKKKKSRKDNRRDRRRRQKPVVDVDDGAEQALDAPLLRNSEESSSGVCSRGGDITSSDSLDDPFFRLD